MFFFVYKQSIAKDIGTKSLHPSHNSNVVFAQNWLTNIDNLEAGDFWLVQLIKISFVRNILHLVVFWKFCEIHTKKTPAIVAFLVKLHVRLENLQKRKPLKMFFSPEDFWQNRFCHGIPRTTASETCKYYFINKFHFLNCTT